MKTLSHWLDEYGESHQNHTNKLFHYFCVPAIMFSLIGLLWSIPVAGLNSWATPQIAPFINWASLFLAFVLLFYARLSIGVFIGMLFISAVLLGGNYYLARFVPAPLWLMSLIIFAVAWIGQFIGHKIEGKKPSFVKDIQFLLIGPAWILTAFYKKIGLQK